MLRHRPRTFSLAAAFVTALATAVPARGQFEEPDTVRKLGVGAFIELTFRGSRGTLANGNELDFSNGPAFGGRLEYRFAETVTLGVLGSYGRSEEKFQAGGTGGETTSGGMSMVNVAGELLFRVKPSVPGFFMIGGGARSVTPDEDEARFGRTDSYTEPFGIFGVGFDAMSRRRGALRFEGRFYLTSAADQEIQETKSLVLDIGIALTYVFRF